MRAVVQRVAQARVSTGGGVIGEIDKGLLVLLGVSADDGEADAVYLADKILGLRIFDDADGKMNLSVVDIDGEILVVSQFTLYGDARRGRRPSFVKAAQPEIADKLYEAFVREVKKAVKKVATGRFRAMMQVDLTNDGPVTILLDSQKNF